MDQMVQALVLLMIEPTYERQVLERIKELEGVTDARMIYGIYDAFLILQANTREEIQSLVFDRRARLPWS